VLVADATALPSKAKASTLPQPDSLCRTLLTIRAFAGVLRLLLPSGALTVSNWASSSESYSLNAMSTNMMSDRLAQTGTERFAPASVYSIQLACHFSLNGQSLPPILKEVDLRFYPDSATAQPHIYKQDVDEEEVEEALTNPGEDRPGRDGSRVAIGQTATGWRWMNCASSATSSVMYRRDKR
jgi:hypothetical protein